MNQTAAMYRGPTSAMRRVEDLGLDARYELHLPRPDFVLQEAIHIERPLGIDAVYHRQRVERNAVAVQHLRCCEHLVRSACLLS